MPPRRRLDRLKRGLPWLDPRGLSVDGCAPAGEKLVGEREHSSGGGLHVEDAPLRSPRFQSNLTGPVHRPGVLEMNVLVDPVITVVALDETVARIVIELFLMLAGRAADHVADPQHAHRLDVRWIQAEL